MGHQVAASAALSRAAGALFAFFLCAPLGWAQGGDPAPAEERSGAAEEGEPTADELFEQGLRAYEAGNFEEARESFRSSYERDPEPRKLYAWAQAERYSGNCRQAIELYDRALETAELSEPQRKVIGESKRDCQRVFEEAKRLSESQEKERLEKSRAEARPARIIVIDEVDERPWYKDPIGGALTGAGVLGVGAGVGFLMASRSARDAALSAETHDEFVRQYDRQRQYRTIGMITAASGAVLVAGGVSWYVYKAVQGGRVKKTEKEVEVSAWAAPGGTGVAVGGRF